MPNKVRWLRNGTETHWGKIVGHFVTNTTFTSPTRAYEIKGPRGEKCLISERTVFADLRDQGRLPKWAR